MTSSKKQESELKDLALAYMRAQLDEIKNNKKKNNSFAYLESSTLNLFMMYLFMNGNNHDKKSDVSEEVWLEICNEIDVLRKNNKKLFEEMIQLLQNNVSNE